jgi:O18-antigen biosynthesis glycosyltransferase
MGDIYYFPEKSIYLCEYMPDGYSNNFNRMLKQNPRGFGMFYLDQLKRLQPGLAWAKALVRYGQCKFFHWTKP